MRTALCLLLLLAAPGAANACTCFYVFNEAVAHFCRNYDWNLERGVLYVNKRGVEKQAFSFDKPAEWTSEYGSVTFNQYGREFPNDGMNEAGLVVAVMWLPETLYPESDERPSVGSAQWVQYQLDTAATVEEVLASEDTIRIWPVGGGLVHYLVTDSTGAAAVIEWVDGKRVVHTGEELVAKCLTNSTYEKSAAYLRSTSGSSGELTRSSLDRFAIAASACQGGEQGSDWSVAKSFTRLTAAAQAGRTKWSIVYDAKNLTVHFKTQSAPEVKRLALGDVDLSSETPTQMLDMATAEPGSVASRLSDYSTERNRAEIDVAFDNTFFLRPWPKAMREQVATYPERCCKPAATATVP